MSKWNVLVCSRHMNMALDRFQGLLKEHDINTHSIVREQVVPASELLPIIADFDGVICSDDEMNRQVLTAGKKLKVVSKWGVGIDSIDQVAAKELGIKIFNSPGAFSESCAVITMGMIIDLARQMRVMDGLVRSGTWTKITGSSLRGKKIGLIGTGNIGKEVIKRAWAFDMEIYAHDIVPLDPAFAKTFGVRSVDRATIITECDFISLHAPLNAQTHHMLSFKEFEAMRPTAFVINTARGPIIDEKALLWALKNKKIAGAGLDVFEVEPLAPGHELLSYPNVVFAAHNSYNTQEAVDFVHENTLKNMVRGLTGLKL